jgi:hypothetical protein
MYWRQGHPNALSIDFILQFALFFLSGYADKYSYYPLEVISIRLYIVPSRGKLSRVLTLYGAIALQAGMAAIEGIAGDCNYVLPVAGEGR